MVGQGFSNETFGSVRKGAASLGMVRFGKVLLEKVCGPAGFAKAGYVMERLVTVRHGLLTKEN